MEVEKVRHGKRFTTETHVVEATLVRTDGSTKHFVLTCDGDRVGYLSRAGSSATFQTVMVHAPAEFKRGTYIGAFDRAAYDVATAGKSWLDAAEKRGE